MPSQTVESARQIPPAYAYVLANDSFMSGWGPATGKVNTVILPCASWEEAEIVAQNARNRSEMRRVRIVARKPRLQRGHLYSLFDREFASRWYEKGGF